MLKKPIIKINEIDFLSIKGRSVVCFDEKDRKHTRTHVLEGAVTYVPRFVSVKKQS